MSRLCRNLRLDLGRLRDGRFARGASVPVKQRNGDRRERHHEQRRELCLSQSGEDGGIGAVEAEEEPADRVEPEIDEAEHAVGQARFQALVEWKQGAKQHERQDHLVRDLGMDDHAGLTQRRGVHVLDAPWRDGRCAVMLAVDDVADPSDGKADHRGRSAGVDELPVRESSAPSPHVSPRHGPEQPAPLADASFGQREHSEDLAAGEEPEVLPHVQKARADQAQPHHPGDAVGAACRVDPVLLQQPEAEARPGEDSEHREHAVPGDQEWPDAKEIGVEVDDDGEKRHADPAMARCRRDIATSLGNRARV